ncbi:MAG: hypothetical protein ACFFG0_54115 [Candidatus Thorarchaeota archaeon]
MLPTDRSGTSIGFRSYIGGIGDTIGLFLSSNIILLVGLGAMFIIFCHGTCFYHSSSIHISEVD